MQEPDDMTSRTPMDKFPEPRTFPTQWDMDAILSAESHARLQRSRKAARQFRALVNRAMAALAGQTPESSAGSGVALLREDWDLSAWQ